MLFEIEEPGFRLSWSVIGIAAAIFIGMIRLSSVRFDVPKRPVRLGARKPCAACCRNPRLVRERGHVFTQGERWQARGTEAFKPGEVVEVANHGFDAGGAAPAGAHRPRRRIGHDT
jgi:membrane-bound serine protease (ClpP class)